MAQTEHGVSCTTNSWLLMSHTVAGKLNTVYAVYVASARMHTNKSCCSVSCTCGSGTHAKQLGHVLVLAASYTDSVIILL